MLQRMDRGPEKDRVIEVVGAVVQPPADDDWCPRAKSWYASLGESAQSAQYEPSDWATAQLCADLIHQALTRPKVPAQIWDTIARMQQSLLTTEEARRRVRLDARRKGEGEEVPDEVLRWRERHGSGRHRPRQ
jgi:hypothetical protein